VIRPSSIAALVLAAACAVSLPTGCGRRAQPGPGAAAAGPAVEAWPPERIAGDPDGYLQYADRRMQQQVAVREQSLRKLDARREEIDRKSTELLQRVEEARNLHRRLAAAVQRADDEDRWPMVFAGKPFTREKANALLVAIGDFEKQREPLATAYRDALQRVAQNQRALRGDIVDLGQMREQLSLDLERVRLNKGMSELAELRKTEAKLANLGTTLVGLDDDPLAGLDDGGTARLDVNDLLK
jgi:hypothetical protein